MWNSKRKHWPEVVYSRRSMQIHHVVHESVDTDKGIFLIRNPGPSGYETVITPTTFRGSAVGLFRHLVYLIASAGLEDA